MRRICTVLCFALVFYSNADAKDLRVAVFNVDVTPPIGSPLCDGLVPPAKEIVDPLSARGIVLIGEGRPVVLCVFDWVGIGNEGHDAFREAIAEAVGTTADRVSVHAVHQHDAPGCDFASERILADEGLGGKQFDPEFARRIVKRVADAARRAMKDAQRVTHVGIGVGVVEKIASNRRILDPAGKKVIMGRMSSCRNPKAIAAPEGVIDPKLRLISFWNEDRPITALMFYATHPMSYYGRGGVSADFVGLARKLREAALPGVVHIYFNGAGGNVAAGKYNDGSPGNRAVLAQRLAQGMKRAWESQTKHRVTAKDLEWRFVPVALPPRKSLEEKTLIARMRDKKLRLRDRIRAGRDLAFLRLMRSGRKINVNYLRIGPAHVLMMPGELFVEYQLAAQKMRPNEFVAMAAYGDYGCGYIGTAVAYTQGGYETSAVSRVAPEVESVLMRAMRILLREEQDK